MNKYEIYKEFRDGMLNAIAVKQVPDSTSPHWAAGWKAGKDAVHEMLNRYLASIGVAPMGVVVPATTCTEDATHRCKTCGAKWRLNPAMPDKYPPDHPFHKETWSLVSMTCGKCCDIAPMGEQIEPFQPPPTPDLRAVPQALLDRLRECSGKQWDEAGWVKVRRSDLSELLDAVALARTALEKKP